MKKEKSCEFITGTVIAAFSSDRVMGICSRISKSTRDFLTLDFRAINQKSPPTSSNFPGVQLLLFCLQIKKVDLSRHEQSASLDMPVTARCYPTYYCTWVLAPNPPLLVAFTALLSEILKEVGNLTIRLLDAC